MALTIHNESQSGLPPSTVGGAVITIGRVEGNDLVVDDPRISSRHGRLVRQGEGYAYEDLGSRNGSLLEREGERRAVEPHTPVAIQSGDRLLLGDLVSPVILRIAGAPTSVESYEGGTVIARRSVIDSNRSLDGAQDTGTLRDLFRLLHNLSGQNDPETVLAMISDAVLARFSYADSVMILKVDGSGNWVVDCEKARRATDTSVMPSRTLMEQAINSLEIVSYVPDGSGGPASVAGLAGTVLVPLVSGQSALGLLHVESITRPFGADALAWLSVVGTHVTASLLAARRFSDLSRSAETLKEENTSLRGTIKMPRPILGESESLLKALRQLERVGRTNTTVLVHGETGTGKELAARYVHAHSGRSDAIFAPLNCGALTEELLNSELFGHKKGSFTGADRDRKGIFESADGGTVFLDEIGEISPTVQVRLLRVLQEREVQPVGSHEPIKVDVRIVAATNRNLQDEVKAGRFREDLYYRLAVFSVRLPPLRERGRDVVALAERFRESACARFGVWNHGFTDEAMAVLRSYNWPGNIRQLEHEVERAVIMAEDGQLIGKDALSDTLVTDRPSLEANEAELPAGRLKDVMGILEERVIRRCLTDHDDNRTRAAEALGISRQALQAKLAKWRDAQQPVATEPS